jgi:hypothetical protein
MSGFAQGLLVLRAYPKNRCAILSEAKNLGGFVGKKADKMPLQRRSFASLRMTVEVFYDNR